jgi:hypothetical protein
VSAEVGTLAGVQFPEVFQVLLLGLIQVTGVPAVSVCVYGIENTLKRVRVEIVFQEGIF